MSTDETAVSRRAFVQAMAVAAASIGAAAPLVSATPPTRRDIVFAIGDLIMPSAPGDPGYRDLEPHGITDEVLNALPGVSDADATLWNTTPQGSNGGKTFLELDADQRSAYTRQVIEV